nr:MAG TPA: hypothetical protein [Caudoviricetes sp.]
MSSEFSGASPPHRFEAGKDPLTRVPPGFRNKKKAAEAAPRPRLAREMKRA